MSGTISDLLSAASDLGVDTVADAPPVDISALSSVIDESDGLDMTSPFMDAATTTPAPDIAPPVETPAAEPPAAPQTPAAPTPPPEPASPQTSAPSFTNAASTDVAESGGTLKLDPTGTRAEPFSLTRAQKALGWFSSLSPGAQAIIAGGMAGGAGAMMSALSQKHMIEYAKERDEKQHQWDVEKESRARNDFDRRHSVAAVGDDAFKPKGIIDARRGA